ncbi:S-layer homology domain-containing protein [Wukongibacter sp. M2B1]|uniref:S-layer homology domain-containing protein n=1 Tax=Wukongibacter sp. M2B1 TaxID=3088895 RepID=UPI003D7A802D
MKKSILVLLLILSFTTQSFAGIKVDVEVNKDLEVEVKIDSSYEREPIAIQVYDDDRRFYIDQNLTNRDGSAEFYFQLEDDKKYDGKVNIDGRQKKFSFSTEEVVLDDTVYVYIMGYEGLILSKTEVEIEEDDTVIDVLERVLEDENIKYKIKNGYVKSIDGQSEFDLGAKSGWMFSINDEFPEIGAENAEVEDGDYIKWLYTTDLGVDIGAVTSGILIEDEIHEALERARVFLKSSRFTEKDMVKIIRDIIELVKDNFSELETRNDAEDLVDYTGDVLRVVEAAVERIESEKYKKEIIDILETLSEFLIESSEVIKEENTKNRVEKDASKIISVLLRATAGMKEDNYIDDIMDSLVEVIIKFNKEKKLELEIPILSKAEVKINFSKGLLENVFKKGIDIIEIKTEIASINIESDTFNNTNRKKDILIEIKKIDELENGIALVLETMINGDKIHNLYEPIDVRVPYSSNGENEKDIAVFLLRDDGIKKKIAAKYDFSTKSVVFMTSELGKYILEMSGKNKKEFTDLNDHEWAKEAVKVMVEKEIVNGRSDTKFDPNAEITRAEFATLIVRVLEYEMNDEVAIPFEDVDANSWYYKYISTAYQNGLINGKTEKEFDPEGSITRQEMTKIIAKVFKNESFVTKEDTELDSFKDKEDIAVWAKSESALVVNEGIITGMEDGRFAPKEKANRAQAVVMLHRLYNLIKAKSK